MTTPAQKPTVSRDVHYHAEGEPFTGPFASKVTAVSDDPADIERGIVDLIVFYPGGTGTPKTRVPFADKPTKHHWSWPPRV